MYSSMKTHMAEDLYAEERDMYMCDIYIAVCSIYTCYAIYIL
jgi:hypothetical protein